MVRLIEETGNRYGRLLVIDRAPNKGQSTCWFCQCDCGNTKVIRGTCLHRRNSPTRSCGCLSRELTGKRSKTHGQSHSPEHNTWTNIKTRCNNERARSFSLYGGRGVKMCHEWENDFELFLQHVGPKPGPDYSIDRIDNSRGYEPGNVRWATRSQQNRNRRPFKRQPHKSKEVA